MHTKAKKIVGILGVALFIITGSTAVILAHQQIAYSDFEDDSKMRPITEVAHTFFDIPYCATDNKRQTLDLLTPKEPLFNKSPLIIYVHGGGWQEGDKENSITEEYSIKLANSGLAAATIDYRLSGEAIYPAQNNDVACAVNYLVGNATKYNLDSNRMIIIGDSAGGQLAAMEAISSNHAFLGVIMAYGVSDLNEQIIEKNDMNAVRYLGSKATELAKSDSPVFAKKFPDTSFLLIHGSDDSVVPAKESATFATILRQNGVDVEFVEIPNAQHAFLGTNDDSDKIAQRIMFQFIQRIIEPTLN